ncbi:MAG: iron transporter [Armatimonadetes bacterium]|nr:iron transporter [Armatimonadota bacterium]
MRRVAVVAASVVAAASLGLSPVTMAGEEDLVVRKVVNDLEVALYMEKPKDMVMADGMAMSGGHSTHHLEVKVFDAKSKACVPYLAITATVTSPEGKAFTVEVPAMIGDAFHYGTNVSLPAKGTYTIALSLRPPKLMRYAKSKDRWAKPASLTAKFAYR